MSGSLPLHLAAISESLMEQQRALQILLIYRWHCIKGTTKPFGNFIVKEAFKCPINYSVPVKQVNNVSDILILFKNSIWNLKCVCQCLLLGLLRILERLWRLTLLSICYQIVAKYLRNKLIPLYQRSDGRCLRYLTRIMTWYVLYLVTSLKNHICLPFMQSHLSGYFGISQNACWSINVS